MHLLTEKLRAVLRANAAAHAAGGGRAGDHDPVPVLKLFNPMGPATWLATELGADGDTLFGLADLGFGCPELGYFSLCEIAALRLPFGLGIERDLGFASITPLSRWTDVARARGSILGAQPVIAAAEAAAKRGAVDPDPGPAHDPAPGTPGPDPLPPGDPLDG
jgi:hypothetical protein